MQTNKVRIIEWLVTALQFITVYLLTFMLNQQWVMNQRLTRVETLIETLTVPSVKIPFKETQDKSSNTNYLGTVLVKSYD